MRLPSRYSLFPFLLWWPHVTRRTLGTDLLVGLSGAILALPQSVAYALIAGLPAEYGLYAAIVPVIIACLWGSSWHLIGGPTAAISIVLFTSVSPMARPGSDEFVALVLLLTFLAGLFQWLLGLMRFGNLVNFVSPSVVLGFTLGAALVIALGQLPNLLGIEVDSQRTAIATLLSTVRHLSESDWHAVLVALFTLTVSLVCRRLWPRLPALLIGVIAGSLLVNAVPGLFASIRLVKAFEGSLPPLSPLQLEVNSLLQLLPAAIACGMLGLVTSLSIARSLASRSQQMLDANLEVRAQGLSNLIGPWFSGSLSAGSFTRSALNLQAGATSPMAGIFSALLVAAFALFCAPLIAHIALPSMAAAILLICWGLVDMDGVRALLRVNRAEFVVMLLTLLATLVLELQTAIYAGVLASLFFYLKRTSQPRFKYTRDGDDELLRLEGSIFFGACHYVQQVLQLTRGQHVLVDARHINFIDYAGVEMLHLEARRLQAQGRQLVLRHARPHVIEEIHKLEGAATCPVQFEE